jgi:hypothetical protein
MLGKALLVAVTVGAALLGSSAAIAACPPTLHSFTNGFTADAVQVNDNFNAIVSCENTLAPLSGPVFAGNVGIGAASTNNLLNVGTSSGQSNALISARTGGNSFEWGHSSTAGFFSTIGAESSSGKPFLAFNAEAGATANTYTTLGLKGTLIRGDLAGGLTIDTVPSASASNQTPTSLVAILASGNVGIGILNPSALLHVNSLSTTATTIGAKDARIVLQNNSFTANAGGEVELGATADTATGRYAAIGTAVQINSGAGASGDVYIATKTLATDTALTARLYVTGAGNVGIGTTTPAFRLDVAGDIRASSCVYFPGGASGTGCVSDLALKRDVEPYISGLDVIAALQPVSFYYNGLGGIPADGVRQLGLIAQDVEKAAPRLVGARSVQLHPRDGKPTSIKTVNYTALTFILINAVKELKASNDRYAAQLEVLKNQVADLQRRSNTRTAQLATRSTP